MKRHILFILTLLFFFYAKSQPNCIFTHYSSENGLSQNSIMSMVQDHNGVLWFSTWDGINRFNGYKNTHFTSGKKVRCFQRINGLQF